jgi:hypothetical protein
MRSSRPGGRPVLPIAISNAVFRIVLEYSAARARLPQRCKPTGRIQHQEKIRGRSVLTIGSRIQRTFGQSRYLQEANAANQRKETMTNAVQAPHLPNSVHPSKVFDTYWRFAAERQAVFFRRQLRVTGGLNTRLQRFMGRCRESRAVSRVMISCEPRS